MQISECFQGLTKIRKAVKIGYPPFYKYYLWKDKHCLWAVLKKTIFAKKGGF